LPTVNGRELARTEAGWIGRAAFSPDGRFVAYSVMGVLNATKNVTCRIFVIPSQGGEPRQVYKSRTWKANDIGDANALSDWTANGRFLVIKDIEDGRSALYLLPIKDGAAAGPAEMVRYGDFLQAFTTASGALVYQEKSAKHVETEVFFAQLNSDGRVESWRRADVRGSRYPDVYSATSFSPSGSEIAYTASDKEAGKFDLVLRELPTGQERILYQSDEHLSCQFASLQPKVFCISSKNYEKTDLISVALETGVVERLGSFDGPRQILQIGADDARFYFMSDDFPKLGPILEWDLATQKETTLSLHSNTQENFAQSPDGNSLVRITFGSNMSVRPVSGGDWKSLISGANGLGWQFVVSMDSKWVYYHGHDQAYKDALFRVSIAGGLPERLGDFPCESPLGGISISPDNRQILATCYGGAAGGAGYDLWVLENFVPSSKK
jgi:Tol biopolymer transport system component